MKRFFPSLAVLLLLNCGDRNKFYSVFTSPELARRVKLEVSGGGVRYSMEDWDEVSKAYRISYTFFEEAYSRAFVGWSPDSATISVLLCGEGGPELLRRTFLGPNSLNVSNNWDSARLADENLASSLKLVRASAPERGYPEADEFEWFCQGWGATALTAYTKVVDGIEEVAVPYQATK